MVALFSLPKIIKYKKGPVAERSKGLRALQREMAEHLPLLDPPVDRISLLKVCRVHPGEGGALPLKELEDILDAVICAYTGLYFWRWGEEKCRIYGSVESGYIVTPINETILSSGSRHTVNPD
jgi:predicted RNase H-like nuclease